MNPCKKLTIAALTGSLRRASCNQGLLREAVKRADEHNMQVKIISIEDIPFFNSDLEAKLPEAVVRIREQVEKADALLFATEEYNYSFSGVLKNAVDWLSRSYDGRPHPMSGKPAALMGAGGGMGTSRAQLHFRQVCVFLNVHPLAKPELHVQRWNRDGTEKFDTDGNITDEPTKEKIGTLLSALGRWTRVIMSGELATKEHECSKAVE